MWKWTILALSILPCAAGVRTSVAHHARDGATPLHRTYTEGAVLLYEMNASNDGWRYTIHATDLIKRDVRGRFYEAIGWSNLTSNRPQALSPVSLAFRQILSLDDPATYMSVPDLSKLQPSLVGPVTDTLTFYSDLLLATKERLMQPGQRAYVKQITPNSWADGQHIAIGQDIVDFDLRMAATSSKEHSQDLVVRHVPPIRTYIEFPAKWMETPVANLPNNFVQVQHEGDTFVADVGQETFEVRLTVDTLDGKITSAKMHNRVLFTRRECVDRELQHCGPPARKTTVREVSLKLLP